MCQHFHRFFHPQQAQVAFLVPQPYHELVEVPSGMQNQLQKNANFICIQNSNKQWNSAIWKLFTITEYCKTTQAIEKVYVVSTCQKFCFQFWEIIQNYFEHKVATILMASWKKVRHWFTMYANEDTEAKKFTAVKTTQEFTSLVKFPLMHPMIRVQSLYLAQKKNHGRIK